MDWQEVGCRHAITFEWPGDGPPPPVLVFAKDPLVRWLRTGSLGTPPQPIVTLAAVRVREALCIAEPVRDLPVGDHILALRSAEDAPFAVVSGVRIADTPRHWGELLPQLVAARRQLGALRTDLPRGVPDAPLFAITTTVFDTDPQFLDELFDCLSRQDHGDFEWLLLDNGSTRADTVQRLRDFAARDPRIRHFRVDDNIHIIPGNRYLLQRARGRYIVPVDSDDLVHADALALFAEQLRGEQPPEILFSEECKVTQDGRAAEYVWRPGFSRLFALATCPAAHLMAFERQMVLRVKAYDDDYAQGSHDWDTTLRLMVAGGRAVRVPHILYGWRMHPGSSAASSEAKDYLRSSQVAVLAHAVARLGLQDRFEVQPTETGHLGYYHLHRRAIAPRPLAVDFVLRGGSDAALDDLGHNLGQLDYPDLQIRVLVPSLIA
ncbi:MAG TPA: glycosyltransferase, partial [Planctomycetota bacterium]|nr:glycosyltransferase [Planctomycetota bacterium]